MKIKLILFLIVIATSFNVYSKNRISHGIAMHGEPKYNEDFLNVEYFFLLLDQDDG